MMRFVACLILMMGVPLLYDLLPQVSANTTQASRPAGRWQVKFELRGVGENTLVFDAQDKRSGSFLLKPSPDDKSEASAHPAVWSETTNDRVSFSSDVELQLGNCCREMGTLIFKGKFESSNSVSGKAIFVGSTIDEENFNGFRSTVGTFKATRLSK